MIVCNSAKNSIKAIFFAKEKERNRDREREKYLRETPMFVKRQKERQTDNKNGLKMSCFIVLG